MPITWSHQLHQTFRFLGEPSDHLRVFLGSSGQAQADVLGKLTFASRRSGRPEATVPDPKRYRDPRFLYETIGLLYEADDGLLVVTDLGRAVERWLDVVTTKNLLVLGRYIVGALAVCQLHNPTRVGQSYANNVRVFPFAFMWRAMLLLNNRINSDELNRAILKVGNEDDLDTAIKQIAVYRRTGDLDQMGEETVTGDSKNDRIIPWMACASFGWTFIDEKVRSGADKGYYVIRPEARDLLKRASAIKHTHRMFSSTKEYVEHISRHALLPPDLRLT